VALQETTPYEMKENNFSGYPDVQEGTSLQLEKNVLLVTSFVNVGHTCGLLVGLVTASSSPENTAKCQEVLNTQLPVSSA
jgi:hypothetical protein